MDLDTDLIISLVSIFILLLLSGFFSGSETALTAVSKAKMHSLEKEGNERAGIVNKLREEKDKLIGALLLGNNLVNILASALATSALIDLFGEAGVFYATAVMTVLVLIFAEVLPKSYAITHSEKMAIAIAPVINFVVKVLAPITQTVIAIVRNVLKIFGIDISSVEEDNKEELIGVIDLHQGDEQEIKEERAMLRSILDLVTVDVDEIITHRSKVEMIDIDKSNKEIVKQILNSRFTRIPLYKETNENIVGVIHAKVLLRALHEAEGDVEKLNISEIANEPWFIPDSTNLFDQLQEFRERREHFALVVDEYGSFEGIVTLEDILEEIVGEIDDEYDISMEGVSPQGNGSFIVDGTVTLRDLNREFEWGLSDEYYSTVAGLVIYEAKLVPEPGQSFVFFDIRFDVLKRKENQITQLRLTPMRKKEEG